ncbi:MAG: hypothetical protein CW338_07215 [Clostridiales bacterium]|nr:hypothetical protein [Clostridiales bacterium]
MGRFMNRYLYGKAGQGDFKKSDLPTTRWQLFFAMLRIRLSGLFRLNLMTCIVFIPLMVVLFSFSVNIVTYLSNLSQYAMSGQVLTYNSEQNEWLPDEVTTAAYANEWSGVAENVQGKELSALYVECSLIYNRFLLNMDLFRTEGFWSGFTGSMLLLLLPCIMITGPVQAGMAHICRNWSRDEHAFIWSDFIDAVKENWKQGLGVSTLSGLLAVFMPTALIWYWGMGESAGGTGTGLLWFIPFGLLLCLSLAWFLGLAFAYPCMVGYQLSFSRLIRNSLVLAAGRLPMVLGLRLCTLAPVIIGALVAWFFPSTIIYVLLIIMAYYILFGNAFTRFCHASYANGVFDKYVNTKIPGAVVNRGLNVETDDDDDDEETGSESENKE